MISYRGSDIIINNRSRISMVIVMRFHEQYHYDSSFGKILLGNQIYIIDPHRIMLLWFNRYYFLSHNYIVTCGEFPAVEKKHHCITSKHYYCFPYNTPKREIEKRSWYNSIFCLTLRKYRILFFIFHDYYFSFYKMMVKLLMLFPWNSKRNRK